MKMCKVLFLLCTKQALRVERTIYNKAVVERLLLEDRQLRWRQGG